MEALASPRPLAELCGPLCWKPRFQNCASQPLWAGLRAHTQVGTQLLSFLIHFAQNSLTTKMCKLFAGSRMEVATWAGGT